MSNEESATGYQSTISRDPIWTRVSSDPAEITQQGQTSNVRKRSVTIFQTMVFIISCPYIRKSGYFPCKNE